MTINEKGLEAAMDDETCTDCYGTGWNGNAERFCYCQDGIDAQRHAYAATTAYIAASAPVEVQAPPFEFDRYVNGRLMAEGVTIEKQTTLEGAMLAAARLASRGPNGEVPVLVLRHTALTTLSASNAEKDADIARLEKERDEARRSSEHWHECFVVLNKAVVGETGLSAITVASELRARAEAAEAALAEHEAETARVMEAKDKALDLVRGIIVEGAATGFNYADGDWAERLYASQAVTSKARKLEVKS